MSKIRLDQLVYDKGFADSREKAKAIVMSGNVYINNQKADKPGFQVNPDTEIDVRINALPFVSRGGYKLDKALKVFNISAVDKVCIDCGASTGGFTDVLLQNGAAKVYSVDVGYGQLAWKLRNDPRVVNLERTNLRYITDNEIPESLDMAVCDVSFISTKLIFPAVKPLLKKDADYISLIKPQFEAGREQVGKHGVIKDINVHKEVVKSILEYTKSIGFKVVGLDYSPIKGPEGNIEFLIHLKNSDTISEEINYEYVVEQAHKELNSI